MNNWNLTNVSDVSVDLSTADAYHNVGNYTVPEDRMLLITASLNYTQLGGSATLETQSFATIVSSDFLREGGIRYLELDRGQFASSDTNLHDFNARFMLKSQWGSHQLQISREDNGQSPFAPVDSAVYSESNSVRVRVFEVGLELSDDVVTQSAIADDSVGLEQLAHGTANKFLGFDESGNPAEKDAPSDTTLWRGDWTAGDYIVGQMVQHAGNIYLCVSARTSANTENPSADTNSWSPLSGGSSTGGGALTGGSYNAATGALTFTRQGLADIQVNIGVIPTIRRV